MDKDNQFEKLRKRKFEEIKEIILNSDLTAEEIYEKIKSINPDIMKTEKIMRSLRNWENCIYKGAIGENDFVVAETDSSSLVADNNIAMKHDDIKETLIRFIEEFRTSWRNQPNSEEINLLRALVFYMPIFLKNEFKNASRDGSANANKRASLAKFNNETQFPEYNVSDCKGPGANAVCVERNSTAGNIFQFFGFETYQITGQMCKRNDEEEINEGHHFIFVKHGPNGGYYSLIDAFNGIIKLHVFEGDCDLTKGFEVNVSKKDSNKTYTYKLSGPLIEITGEMLNMESQFKESITEYTDLDRKVSEIKKRKNAENIADVDDVEKKLKELKQKLEELRKKFEEENVDESFKNRLLERINAYIKLIANKEEIIKQKKQPIEPEER